MVSPTSREICCHLEAKFSTSQGPQRHPLDMFPSYQGTCPSDPGDPSLHTRTGGGAGGCSPSPDVRTPVKPGPATAGESGLWALLQSPFRAELGPKSPSHASKARRRKNGAAGVGRTNGALAPGPEGEKQVSPPITRARLAP